MDGELKDVLQRIEGGVARVERKQESLAEKFTAHDKLSEVRYTELKDETDGAHSRLDDHEERRKETRQAWPTWIQVLLAAGGFLLGVATFAFVMMQAWKR